MLYLKTIFYLSRPINIIITLFVVYISSRIGLPIRDSFLLLAIYLNIVLTLAAGNLINDFYDFELDNRSLQSKTLRLGIYDKSVILISYILLQMINIFLFIFEDLNRIIILILVNIILFLYSRNITKLWYLKNFIVSSLTAYVIFFVASVLNSKSLFLMSTAFCLNFAREIVKDFEDLDNDRSNGRFTMAAKFPVKSRYLTIVYLILNLVISIIYFEKHGMPFLFSSIIFILTSVTISMIIKTEKWNRISLLIKITIATGLLLFWLTIK
ncbi:MAG: UbiA family prenyltransferase [Candidatus Delongbacteria bacterium]|nr:UbiA family prenyltransferase [Candidatus Delongbacteria bacterium]